MKSFDGDRSDLIRELYNSYHEGEAELPNYDDSRNYIYDEGTGTLYCKETDTKYEKNDMAAAEGYFKDVAAAIEASLSTSADPYKQKKKIVFCKIAAEAIEYMMNQLEHESETPEE